jgi:indolepyruvate ferredoxin oxidoreductase beta subunit
MESLRYLPYLKKDGWFVTNDQPFINIPNYPDLEKIKSEIEKLPNKVMLDVETIAKSLGSVRVANMVMLGAATPFLNMDYQKIAEGIRTIFATKNDEVIALNLKALQAGYEVAIKKSPIA